MGKCWPANCLSDGMTIKLNTRILQHITKQISSGKVIWAVLTLNEYNLSESDPLAKCLRQKARMAIQNNTSYKNSTDLFSAVLGGKKYSELNLEEQSEIRYIDSQTEVKNLYKKNVVLTDYTKRKQLRQANGIVNVINSKRYFESYSKRRNTASFLSKG